MDAASRFAVFEQDILVVSGLCSQKTVKKKEAVDRTHSVSSLWPYAVEDFY